MDSQNGHAARERLLRTTWPKDKTEAPAAKALFEAAKIEQAQEDAAADEARRLKKIRELCAQLKYLTLGSCQDRWKRIAEIVDTLRPLITKDE